MKFSRLFFCIGLLQGLLLWWLSHTRDSEFWPVDPIIRTSILFIALFVPLVIYWTRAINELSKTSRRFIILFYLIAYAALGAYSGWALEISQTSLSFNLNHHFSTLLASTLLCFVSLHLIIGFDTATRRWKYVRLFHYSWRNSILILTTVIITAAFWIVLYAGAELMTLIDVHWIEQTIQRPIFKYPATTLVIALAFCFGLTRSSLTELSRRFALSIASWLLVLILFFAVIWIITIPFVGISALFQTQSTSLITLWFIALTIKFLNCVYQDGQTKSPYPTWLNLATQLAWLSLLPIVSIAAWALFLRVQQYGWTPERLWAALITAVALVYVVGYALSWLHRTQWMSSVGHTNIVAGIILCAGLIAYLTPIADVNRISVASHINKAKTSLNNMAPDWTFLRNQSGRFGTQALESMAAGIGVPAGSNWSQRAKEILTFKKLSRTNPSLTGPELINRFNVYPNGQTIPADFLEYVQSPKVDLRLKNCIAFKPTCYLWMGNLKGDGPSDIVFFDLPAFGHNGVLFSRVENQWAAIGSVTARGNAPITEIQLNEAQIVSSEWRDLIIANTRYRIILNPYFAP